MQYALEFIEILHRFTAVQEIMKSSKRNNEMKNVYCRKSLYVRNTKKYEKYL
jgi:hypothetical protein